ncbi:MAG: hypothetical protein MUF43_10045 [Flavobacterium sp.]|jgi:hypothetical protein|nr:hypothetical protein [Flavobacterium sp.]
MKTIIIFSAILLLNACGKPSENDSKQVSFIREEIRSYFVTGKVGSYFIYEDSFLKMKDTLTIDFLLDGFLSPSCPNGNKGYIQSQLKSKLNDDRYGLTLIMESDCEDTVNSVSIGRSVGNYGGIRYSKAQGYHNYRKNQNNEWESYKISPLVNYNNGINTYDTVFMIESDGLYFWAKNVGIIQYGKGGNWKLIDYNLKK